MRISLQPAFILHHRPYRETSLLLDVFTQEHGKVSLVARGIRTKNSRLRSILQPFIPLLISWYGKGELKTLSSAETNTTLISLKGECLLSGFYLNELLSKVLQKEDPYPRLYTIYQNTLLELQGLRLAQRTLRLFEKRLLEELGYGLGLQKELSETLFYQFHPEEGFTPTENLTGFSGKSLLALAKEELQDEAILREIKHLMRFLLATLLGIDRLNSRQLFIKR